MEEKSNVTKLTQKDYQKKYDEKTQSVTIKYTPADMSDFDRMMKYLDRTGKSRSSFIKELINDFFESGKDKKHVVSKENEKAEYFKFEFIDDEDLDKLKLLLNNDNKYNRTLDAYAHVIESDIEDLVEEKASLFTYWISELQDMINCKEIDINEEETFDDEMENSIFDYIK